MEKTVLKVLGSAKLHSYVLYETAWHGARPLGHLHKNIRRALLDKARGPAKPASSVTQWPSKCSWSQQPYPIACFSLPQQFVLGDTPPSGHRGSFQLSWLIATDISTKLSNSPLKGISASGHYYIPINQFRVEERSPSSILNLDYWVIPLAVLVVF